MPSQVTKSGESNTSLSVIWKHLSLARLRPPRKRTVVAKLWHPGQQQGKGFLNVPENLQLFVLVIRGSWKDWINFNIVVPFCAAEFVLVVGRWQVTTAIVIISKYRWEVVTSWLAYWYVLPTLQYWKHWPVLDALTIHRGLITASRTEQFRDYYIILGGWQHS